MNYHCLLVAVVLLLSAFANASTMNAYQQFEAFKMEYKKHYNTPAEEFYRFGIFVNNLHRAEQINQMKDNRAEFGVTQFMDMTPEEFRQVYLNFQRTTEPINDNKYQADQDFNNAGFGNATTTYPQSFNWAALGAVTQVYNQGQCGSCWAFSATETIESYYYLAKKANLTNLSMQQLVSCASSSSGCSGGNPVSGYNSVIAVGGIESYQAYPYTSGNGANGQCLFNANSIAAKISSWSYVTYAPYSNENLMLQTTYSTGPLSVCVDATIWQYYRGGVLNSSSGCGNQLNHCVQLTGWGPSSDGSHYWIVRNSWGSYWGIQGYIYLQMFQDVCGVADFVTNVSI